MGLPIGGTLVSVGDAGIMGTPSPKLEAFFFNGRWWTQNALQALPRPPGLELLPAGHFSESSGNWSVRVWTNTQRTLYWKELGK